MNIYYVSGIPISDELYHHGIQGQKWGIRRYQNFDGTLTPAGRARYGKDISSMPDSKLNIQNKRLIANNRNYPVKQAEAMMSFFKEIKSNSDRRGIDAKKAQEIGEKYIRNLAVVRLKAMGYEANDKNVEYLTGKKWFRNSTLLSNTLATFGVSGVDFTSNNDYKYRSGFN